MDSVLRLKGGTEPVLHCARFPRLTLLGGVLGNIWYSYVGGCYEQHGRILP